MKDWKIRVYTIDIHTKVYYSSDMHFCTFNRFPILHPSPPRTVQNVMCNLYVLGTL